MTSRRSASAAALAGMREVLTGSYIRDLAGLSDAGELALVRVGNIDSDATGAHVDASDHDVWIHATDELSGAPIQARLHIPGNVLFVLPDAGDTAVVARPRGVDVPGAAYLLHGDGGAANRFPEWLDATTCGLYARKRIRIEAANNQNVELEGDKIKFGFNATRGVARLDDALNCGTLTLAVGGVGGVVIGGSYTHADGTVTVIPPSTTINIGLDGKISTASNDVKSK